MPNQYTKAEESGGPKPKGSNQFTTGKRVEMDEGAKDKLRAERAAQVAESIMNDPESSKDQRLAAAKVLLPYGKSSLQSIESRIVDQPQSEAELMAQLHTFLLDPRVRAQLRAHLEAQDQPANDTATQQSTAAEVDKAA